MNKSPSVRPTNMAFKSSVRVNYDCSILLKRCGFSSAGLMGTNEEKKI